MKLMISMMLSIGSIRITAMSTLYVIVLNCLSKRRTLEKGVRKRGYGRRNGRGWIRMMELANNPNPKHQGYLPICEAF